MSKKDLFTIDLKVFKLSEDALFDYVYRQMKLRFGVDNVKATDYYIWVRNGGKILLDSHLDVVYNWNRTGNDMVVNKFGYLWSPVGIGGDDRCGVQIMLWIAKSRNADKFDYLFTTGEESGCIGAKKFSSDVKNLDCDYYFMIGLDREKSDFVVYRYNDDEWVNYIAKVTGRSKGIGSVSDISHIDLGVMGVNLGIGYVNNHWGAGEYVVVKDMVRAYNDVIKLMNDAYSSGKKWVYEVKVIDNWRYKWDWQIDYKDELLTGVFRRDWNYDLCYMCGIEYSEWVNEYGVKVCSNCIADNLIGVKNVKINRSSLSNVYYKFGEYGICSSCNRVDDLYVFVDDAAYVMCINCVNAYKTEYEKNGIRIVYMGSVNSIEF